MLEVLWWDLIGIVDVEVGIDVLDRGEAYDAPEELVD